jgi:hydroxypyruvate isomerase
MARFAPNFYHLFLELPVRERFAAAARAGFDAVEWHLPYELSKHELKSLCDDNGLRFLYAVVPADWEKTRGLGGHPDRVEDFKRAADDGLDYASHVGFQSLNVGPGRIPPGHSQARCIDTFVRNLEYICDQAKGTGVTLVIEPVCTAQRSDYVLHKMQEAAEIMKAVGRDNLKLVYDTYHLRMEETGTLSALLDEYYPMLGHVQFGNAPTRNEPGVGEIDFDFLIRRLDAKGYAGWVGLEYNPSVDSWSSLAWMERHGICRKDHG